MVVDKDCVNHSHIIHAFVTFCTFLVPPLCPSLATGCKRYRYHYNIHTDEVSLIAKRITRPLCVRGCRIGPTYPPACRKRRLIGGSLFAVGCDPCQWKRGSWLLSQFFVAALRRQYTALASISLSQKVKMAWLNQSAGSAKP